MKTEIIKLWDNENYEYPLIEIKEGNLETLKAHLKTFQKKEDYNIDDFLLLLEGFDWFVKTISYDSEVFF